MRGFIAVLAMLGVGCSNSSDDDNNTAPPDVSPVIERLAAAQCRKILECCDGAELEQVFGGGSAADQESCEQAVLNQAAAFLRPALERALSVDAVELKEGEVADCVTALDARSCGEFEPLASADVLRLPGCEGVVTARLTLSAFCQDDFECTTGFCAHPAADIEGACKNPPQTGEPCSSDRCDTGLACLNGDVCGEKLGLGEVCARNADCRSDLCVPDDLGELACNDVAEICAGP